MEVDQPAAADLEKAPGQPRYEAGQRLSDPQFSSTSESELRVVGGTIPGAKVNDVANLKQANRVRLKEKIVRVELTVRGWRGHARTG
jgi:hypothetical protein